MRTLVGCCLIHLCIGSIYAFSVLYSKFIESTGWSTSVLITGFSLSILSLGLTASFHQKIFSGIYKKISLSYGMLFWVTGMLGMTLNLYKGWNSEVVHWLFSVILGAGVGILYVIPINIITTVSKKAIAAGSVVMFFGSGSVISAKIFSELTLIPSIITLIGILLYALGIIVGILLIKDNSKIESGADFKCDKQWKILAAIFFLNIGIGISVLSNLTILSLDNGFSLESAVLLVAAAGFANTLGRFMYPAMLDRKGYFLTLNFMVDLQVLLLILISVCSFVGFSASYYWSIGAIFIVSIYGGMFAIMPSLMKQLYNNPTAYSRVLAMWGVSGMVCPMLFDYGGFSVLLIMGGLLAVLSAQVELQ